MKYFTHEWYHDTLVSQMCFSLRKSAKAAIYSDKFFDKLYKKEKKWYVRFSKRTARYTRASFDVKAAEESFDKNYRDNLEFVQTLPGEITSKIADMRVFALGTVEYSMANEITRYCGQVNKKCEQVSRDYEASLEPIIEKLGRIKVEDLYLLKNAEITSVEIDGNSLVITSDSNEFKLTLKDFSGEIADSLKLSVIIAHELVSEDDEGFKLSFLCEATSGEIFEASFSLSDYEISTIK